MATLGTPRAFALGTSDNGSGPRRLPLPVAATNAFTPGAISTTASGLAVCATAATATNIIGIVEESVATAAITAGTTLVQHTLVLPGFIYECTLAGAASDRSLVGGTKHAQSMTNSYFMLANATAASVHVILGLVSDLAGVFTTNAFVAQSGTAATAGSVNRTLAATKGTTGDTNARVWFTFTPAGCVLAV